MCACVRVCARVTMGGFLSLIFTILNGNTAYGCRLSILGGGSMAWHSGPETQEA